MHFSELLPHGSDSLHWGRAQQTGAGQRQSSRCVQPSWRTTRGTKKQKAIKTEKPDKQKTHVNILCVRPRPPALPGHAPSTSLEQLSLEPRLQPDPQRQLGGEAHPVDDAGLRQCHRRALPEGGDRAAAQTCRHAHRPASWVLALKSV